MRVQWRERWRVKWFDMVVEGGGADSGDGRDSGGSGVCGAEVITIGGGLCGFVDGVGGGGTWRGCARETAGDLEDFGPKGGNVSGVEELKAAAGAFVDRLVLIGRG